MVFLPLPSPSESKTEGCGKGGPRLCFLLPPAPRHLPFSGVLVCVFTSGPHLLLSAAFTAVRPMFRIKLDIHGGAQYVLIE